MNTPLVITPCGATKQPGRHPVTELYRGQYFASCLRYARTIAPDRDIRILSARHGLLTLDTELTTYEQQFGKPGAITTPELINQARLQKIAGHNTVVALGGKHYRQAALAIWPHATTPLAGLRGIGDHLAELKRLTNNASSPTQVVANPRGARQPDWGQTHPSTPQFP